MNDHFPTPAIQFIIHEPLGKQRVTSKKKKVKDGATFYKQTDD